MYWLRWYYHVKYITRATPQQHYLMISATDIQRWSTTEQKVKQRTGYRLSRLLLTTRFVSSSSSLSWNVLKQHKHRHHHLACVHHLKSQLLHTEVDYSLSKSIPIHFIVNKASWLTAITTNSTSWWHVIDII